MMMLLLLLWSTNDPQKRSLCEGEKLFFEIKMRYLIYSKWHKIVNIFIQAEFAVDIIIPLRVWDLLYEGF